MSTKFAAVFQATNLQGRITMRSHLFKAVPFALAASFVQAQIPPEAMQKAVEVHPEIQAGVNARIAADYEVTAAKGGYLPKIDLLGGYGRESSDNTTTRAASNSHDWKTMNRGESTIRLQQTFSGFGTENEVGRQQATANSRGYALLNTTERTADGRPGLSGCLDPSRDGAPGRRKPEKPRTHF
jgi:adhesin transport system outer membrane protein